MSGDAKSKALTAAPAKKREAEVRALDRAPGPAIGQDSTPSKRRRCVLQSLLWMFPGKVRELCVVYLEIQLPHDINMAVLLLGMYGPQELHLSPAWERWKANTDIEEKKDAKDGTVRRYIDGELGTPGNLQPAVIWADGSVEYHRYGQRHRDGDQPAVILASGRVEYCRDGWRHRDGDQPAVIWANGCKEYYRDGKQHRDGDQPAGIYSNGDVEYWRDGKRHRDGDQPAVIYATGHTEYWRDGKRHRDGGQPAVIHADGQMDYWRDGHWHFDGDQPAVV